MVYFVVYDVVILNVCSFLPDMLLFGVPFIDAILPIERRLENALKGNRKGRKEETDVYSSSTVVRKPFSFSFVAFLFRPLHLSDLKCKYL